MVGKITRQFNLILRSGFHYYRMAMVKPPFWICLRGKCDRVAAEDTLGATTIYCEVIVEDCYDILGWARSHSPQVIVDIGANIGLFSQMCSMVFPEAQIYAYEPHPEALKWLRQNAQNKQITVVEGAVSSQSGELRLDLGEDSTIAQVSPMGQFAVNKVDIATLAENQEIDFLKMDCEGSEWDILQDESLLQRTQFFCLEYHLSKQQSLADLKLLIQRGQHQVTRIKPQPGCQDFGVLWSMRQD
ncbi:MAG: FkbM family methyltransferase [Jaaginema sp. PMC 1079.18]|nr:FkbM family methyltransferase [Jaaginema sp. PMC 1080.18]MEC4852154.1 FkbM family methyltransferase [Jaaginema sp. PMC 1079.18]MEC4867498.1 FkbM family methyltransferase [Jaaginema sp. PMC 1078.18]